MILMGYQIGAGSKVECVFPGVIKSEFRTRQYRDDNHRKHAPLVRKYLEMFNRQHSETLPESSEIIKRGLFDFVSAGKSFSFFEITMQLCWSSCLISNLTSPLNILDGDDVISGDSIAFRSKEFDMKLEVAFKKCPAGKRVNLDFQELPEGVLFKDLVDIVCGKGKCLKWGFKLMVS